MKKDRIELIPVLISVFIWVLIYQTVSIIVKKPLLVPAVGDIIKAFAVLCGEAWYWNTVFFSVLRVIVGFTAAVVVGVVLAFASYFYKAVYHFFYPVLNVMRATPVASFIILSLLWLKSGYVPAFMSFLMVLPLIWGNILQGLRETDNKLLEMAEVFEFSFSRKIKMIYIPQAMPFFRTACVTGLGFAWKSGIAAEVISTPQFSIGKGIYESKIYLETPELFAWTLTVIVLSFMAEKAIKAIFSIADKSR
ncbi:ABC transporter permease subunit [Lachnospiraceae bacterium NSJ-143]|nr:ABC transporter permease subunit [Lachnospiraceae bacterium NSJ-143]